LRRLFDPVVPNQVKWSLPTWVQKPFVAWWRAPMSSTVIQAALVSPARSTSRLCEFRTDRSGRPALDLAATSPP
jgi:hypothetical protein